MNKLFDLYNGIKNRDIGPLIYDRSHNVVFRERMPIYNWIENRIMYTSPMDKINQMKTIRKWLHSETINSGHRYNTYQSVKKIRPFIDMYNINMKDFQRENPSDYISFSDFFTRKVKPEA